MDNWDDEKLGFSWVDQAPKNWERRKRLKQLCSKTYSVLEKLQKFEDIENFRDDILNIFFKLTSYPDGSIVHVRDLLDETTAQYFFTQASNFNSAQAMTQWKLAVEGILFTLLNMGIELPAHPWNIRISQQRTPIGKFMIYLSFQGSRL